MNWDLIKQKYPKAWDNLFEMFNDGILESEITFENEPTYISDIIQYEKQIPLLFGRILYDFFDERGIIINVEYTDKDLWAGILYNKDAVCILDDVYTEGAETRTEAETAAFTKAFELLEERL